MKRGEVYWADLIPRSGAEQTGRRPVVVVSHDGLNQTAGWMSIIVVPLSTSSSQAKRGPTVPRNQLGGAKGGEYLLFEQVVRARKLLDEHFDTSLQSSHDRPSLVD